MLKFNWRTSDNMTAGGSHSYRPDIDGLRAVAVLSVVFFHLSKSYLPGGFLGVDMFFVISGYLISSILTKDAQVSGVSITRFYERRIRRIAPALLVLLLVTSVVSAIVLLPLDLEGLGKSLAATLLFASNVYFWRDTNYFSQAAEEKPLLHTWSLGVEEQFYIFFPLLVAFVFTRWRGAFLPIVAILTVASFVLNILLVRAGGALPAFYLLPTRAWELGVGVILTVWRVGSLSLATRQVVAAVSSILIAIGLAFPDAIAAVGLPVASPVVLGTAGLIWAGSESASALNRVLALRPLVTIGLLSYSLYLWHWPILMFYQYYTVDSLSPLEQLVLVFFMLTASWLSWRFVERPFRSSSFPIGRLTGWSLAVMAVLGLGAASFVFSGGLPQRLSGDAAAINAAVGTHFRCAVGDYVAFGAGRGCSLTPDGRNVASLDLVLLGDSHAQMYAPVVTELLDRDQLQGLLVPANGCMPMRKLNVTADCLRVAEANLSAVLDLESVQTVVVAFYWDLGRPFVDASNQTYGTQGIRAIEEGLDGTIDALSNAGKNVVLIGPLAAPGYDVASIVGRKLAFGQPIDVPLSKSAAEFYLSYKGAIDKYSNDARVTFVRPDLVQCDDSECAYIKDGRSYFSDSNHLARAALASFFGPIEAGLAALRAKSDASPRG